MNCVICKNKVDGKKLAQDVRDNDLEYIFEQADSQGMESLTEKQQVLFLSYVCSVKCYREVI